MSVAELKTDLIQLAMETDNPSMLQNVIDYFKDLQKQEDWWDTLSEDEKSFVAKSARQIAEKKVLSNESVRAEINQLLRK
jgi:hypothetical protein